MFCKNCLREIDSEVEYCPYCGERVDSTTTESCESNDVNKGGWLGEPAQNVESVFLNIISFLSPFFGVIMYCMLKTSDAGKARGVYEWSKIGLIFTAIGSFIIVIYLLIMFNGTTGY